ncbi:hypothetical protein M8818_007125 [Zalaria obscura]|uniref:Uncharacterized protein n=1 Tax=Zalaria obscura TaxID=2024903 RepID=A0ACC3S5Y4_9PEZI
MRGLKAITASQRYWQEKTGQNIDFSKLAAEAGFKNAGSASACWRPIMKKLDKLRRGLAQDNVTDGGGDAGTAPTPRKRKAVADQSATPKKAKNGKGTKTVVDDDDDDELISSPVNIVKK